MNLRPRDLFAGLLATFVFGVGALACSVNVEADQGATSAQKLAVVDVRVHQQAVVTDAVGLDASARFVSVKEPGAPADALDLLGLSWSALPIGACSAVDAAPPVKSVRVDLRDLSPVSLQLKSKDGGAFSFQLEPKAFPDVAGLVSGVVFSAAPGATLENAPKFVTVQLPGASIGDLELPDLPQEFTTNAPSLDGTYFVDAGGIDLGAAPLPSTDRLEIDIVRGGLLRARCGMDASGRLHIDAAAFGGQGDATLVLRAQRRTLRDDATLGSVDARLERSVDVKILVR